MSYKPEVLTGASLSLSSCLVLKFVLKEVITKATNR